MSLDAVMLKPFEASFLKIERAKKHIQELESEIATFFACKPFRLIVEPWEGNEKLSWISHAWVVRISKQFSVSTSTIVGDAIHNLRSSLDLLLCDLVRIEGKSPKGVYFPFCDHQEDLPEMIKRRNVNRAGPDVVRIIKDLKPYKGGNIGLRAIHDMNILDKHQALVPVVAGGATPAVVIAFNPTSPTNVPSIKSKINHDGQCLMVMPPVANLPIGTELEAEWHIVFGTETGPIDGHGVVETLHQLTSLTEGVVQLFSIRFPGPYTKLHPSGS